MDQGPRRPRRTRRAAGRQPGFTLRALVLPLALVTVLVLVVASWRSGGDDPAWATTASPADTRAITPGSDAERPGGPRPAPVPAALAGDTSASDAAPLLPGTPAQLGPARPHEGRSASLSLETTRLGLPCPGRLVVLEGPDAGRSVDFGADGPLDLSDLLPGRTRIEVSSADGWRCVRELTLRHDRLTSWQLDIGHHGWLSGTVVGAGDAPLPGATATLDGQPLLIDGDGGFRVARLASGAAQLVVRHAGHATQVYQLPERDGDVSLAVALPAAGSLSLQVPPCDGLAGEVVVLLVPRGLPRALPSLPGQPSRGASPALFGPHSVDVGGRLQVDDLPPCELAVIAWHAGARGAPTSGWISAGRTAELSVRLEPAPRLEVRVVRGDEPAAGVRATLRWANPARERRALLADQAALCDRAPVPLPPQLRQASVSDAEGLLGLARDPRTPRPAWLELTDPVSGQVLTRVIESATTELLIDLERPLR